MRWLSFFILVYIALGLQAGLARAIEYKNAAPNFVLLVVIFIALSAPRDTALLACFILGAMHDFASQGTLGLLAFTYGFVAVFIASIQQAVGRRNFITHFILTIVAGVIAAVILSLHGWLRPPAPGAYPPALPLFYSAIYSAILAPLILGFLQKIRGVFHFQTSRGRM
jgi:rod shape-determining protein MreD